MGCMHMVCTQCKHEFCWMCHGKWSTHGERTGGFYSCNRYEKVRDEEGRGEEERRRARGERVAGAIHALLRALLHARELGGERRGGITRR